MSFGCASEPDKPKAWQFGEGAVGDDTTLPEFHVGNLKFTDTWVPNQAHAGMEFESYFTLESAEAPNYNIYIRQSLVKLEQGVLSELDNVDLEDLLADEESRANGVVVPVSNLLIKGIKANTPQRYDLKNHHDKYYSLPKDIAAGTYAVVFSINEVDFDSAANAQTELGQSSNRNKYFHAAATTIVGDVDEPNIRILHSKLSNNSFVVDMRRQAKERASGPISAPDPSWNKNQLNNLEPPEITLNLEVESMAHDMEDPVEIKFELGVPDQFGVVAWHTLSMPTPYGNPIGKGSQNLDDKYTLYPDPETGVALVNEEPVGKTYPLYLSESLKASLYYLPYDLNCKLRVTVDPDSDIEEWDDAGAPNKRDNTVTLPIVFLSNYVDVDSTTEGSDGGTASQSVTQFTSKAKSKGNNNLSSGGENPSGKTEIDLTEFSLDEQLDNVWRAITRPPHAPWQEFDTVYPEKVFDVSKSSVSGNKGKFAAGYQFKAHLYYQNYNLFGEEIPGSAKFGTYNWVKAWLFNNEITFLSARAQADVKGYSLTESYFQYDTHVFGIKIFGVNYFYENGCKDGCEVWNSKDGEGNERFAVQKKKSSSAGFGVADVPITIEGGAIGTIGVRGAVTLYSENRVQVDFGPFLNLTGFAEGSVSIGIVSAAAGIELTILDVYQKFSPSIQFELKPGYNVQSRVNLQFAAPLEIKTLDGRLYVKVNLDLLFYSHEFDITIFKWNGLSWAINWMGPFQWSWAISPQPKPALVAYYTMDDISSCASGTCTVETGGETEQVYNARGSNLTPTVDRFGRENSAGAFNGSSSNIVLDKLTRNYPTLQTGSYSVSMWVKRKNPYAVFMTRGTTLNKTALHSNHFWSGLENDAVFWTYSMEENKWSHYLLVVDDPNHYLYIDGQLVKQGSKDITTNCCTTEDKWTIGQYPGWGSSWAFEGAMDDIRIYNYGISPEQAKTLYNEGGWGVSGNYANVTFAPFDDSYAVDDYFFSNGVTTDDDITEKVNRLNDSDYLYVIKEGQHIQGASALGGASKDTFTASAWVAVTKEMYYRWPVVNKTAPWGETIWQIMGKKYGENDSLVNLKLINGRFFLVWKSAGGRYYLGPDCSSCLYFYTPQIKPGQMYHLAATFERKGSSMDVKFYLDGKQLAAYTSGLISALNDYPAYSIFGADSWTPHINSLDGYNPDAKTNPQINFYLRDPRVYNYAMDSLEVQDLYAEYGTVDSMAGMLAHYEFNGNLADNSGMGYDATSTGSVTYTYDRYGNPDSALYFDGTGSSSVKPTFDVNYEGRHFAVSFWMKPEVTANTRHIAMGLMGENGYSGIDLGVFNHTSGSYGKYVLFNVHNSGDPLCESGNYSWCSNVIDRYVTTAEKWKYLSGYPRPLWHHVVAQFKVDNAVVSGQLYVDGGYAGELAKRDLSDTKFARYLQPNIIIGKDSEGNAFKGTIDDVYYFERYLQAYEVKELHEEGRGLAAHYPFDNFLTDVVSGDSATNSGAVPAADNELRANRSYYFDGSDTVSLDPTNFSLTGDFTISMWAMREGTCTLGSCTLIKKGSGPNNIFTVHPEQAKIVDSTGDTRVTVAKTEYENLPSHYWHHYLVTRNGKELQMYVDGVAQYANTVGYRSVTGTDPFVVGEGFTGLIDNIRVYNYGVNKSEASKLYSENTGLVAFYPFDGSKKNALGDYSPLTFFPGPSATSPTHTTGFDGTANSAWSMSQYSAGQYIIMEGPGNFNLDRELSISLWFKQSYENNFPRIFSVPGRNKRMLMDIRLGVDDGVTHKGDNKRKILFRATGRVGTKTTRYEQEVLLPDRSFQDGKWHYLVAKINEFPNTMTLYIDGERLVYGDFFGSIETGPGYRWRLGYTSYDNPSAYPNTLQGAFLGTLDNLQIANKANLDSTYNLLLSQRPSHPYTLNYGLDNNARLARQYGTLAGAPQGNRYPQATADHDSIVTGLAYNFDGLDDYIYYHDSMLKFPRNEVTATAWIRMGTGNTGCRPVIGYAPVFVLKAGECGDNNVRFQARNYNLETKSVNAGTGLRDNQWHFIAGRIKNGTLTVFIDGQNAGSTSFPGKLEKLDEPIRVGSDADSNLYFKGDIDQARVYNYGLNDGYVNTVYNQ